MISAKNVHSIMTGEIIVMRLTMMMIVEVLVKVVLECYFIEICEGRRRALATVHALNKLPYSKLDSKSVGIKEVVVFSTYSSPIASFEKGLSRLQQLVQWFGSDYDRLIVFDECHKAKNLVPEAGGQPTRTGEAVLDGVLPLLVVLMSISVFLMEKTSDIVKSRWLTLVSQNTSELWIPKTSYCSRKMIVLLC
ncbi:protein FORGETTER 1 [Tanacetum coccineum]